MSTTSILAGLWAAPGLAPAAQEGGLPDGTVLLIGLAIIFVVWLLILWNARQPRDVPVSHAEEHDARVAGVEPGETRIEPAATRVELVETRIEPVETPSPEQAEDGFDAVLRTELNQRVAGVELGETPSPVTVETPSPVAVQLEPVAVAAAPAPDDLLIIEGIGPKIAGVLNAAGITTFAQLAAADPGQLKEILLAAGLRLNDPATWPEQARLAAAGDWDGFNALTADLKGGRRV